MRLTSEQILSMPAVEWGKASNVHMKSDKQ